MPRLQLTSLGPAGLHCIRRAPQGHVEWLRNRPEFVFDSLEAASLDACTSATANDGGHPKVHVFIMIY